MGVPLMDAQHKELAGLINRIGEDLKAGHDAERLHESFARLVEAARAHFAAEEQLMAQVGLGAAAERHKQEHRRLIEELESQADALEGRSMSLTMRYLNFWLLHHIESTDLEQAGQLIGAPVGQSAADLPATRARTAVDQWHRAVRRGMWVAPEPRSESGPTPSQLH